MYVKVTICTLMCYDFAVLKDVELSEEDQMMRAIAMSLGEDILVSTDQVWANAYIDELDLMLFISNFAVIHFNEKSILI